MNFISQETAQKLRGGFYTAPAIASFLASWIKNIKPKTVLEPSCGDGAFIHAIEELKLKTIKKVVACELDPIEAQKAKERSSLPVQIYNTDFLRWFLSRTPAENRFDAVVGNPPFIRYQYLPKEQQALAETIFDKLNLPFTKHTNAWVPFVLASIQLLRPGGRLAMVVPSELFHIPHAQSLRTYLADQCSRILVLDPEDIWFEDTLQGTVLLLAEKKQNSQEKSLGVAIRPVSTREGLNGYAEDYFQNSSYVNNVSLTEKWMPLFLSPNERALVADIKALSKVKSFSDIASVDVGIVTGANKFFLVPDSVVEEYGLQKWAHPMFGRSNHVKGLIYSLNDHASNKCDSLPANFLWFQEDNIEDLPSNVRRYLDLGLSQKLESRFKCRTRKTWYKVPSVYRVPIAMLKRAHHYPRLVLNNAGAFTTDTAYRIRTIGIEPAALVLGFVNSLTCLTAEMEGRHYGGGVLELVPSEIERLLVPVIKASDSELKAADRRFRIATDDSEFLRKQDAKVLGQIGVAKKDQDCLYSAWLKLRGHRQRTPVMDE